MQVGGAKRGVARRGARRSKVGGPALCGWDTPACACRFCLGLASTPVQLCYRQDPASPWVDSWMRACSLHSISFPSFLSSALHLSNHRKPVDTQSLLLPTPRPPVLPADDAFSDEEGGDAEAELAVAADAAALPTDMDQLRWVQPPPLVSPPLLTGACYRAAASGIRSTQTLLAWQQNWPARQRCPPTHPPTHPCLLPSPALPCRREMLADLPWLFTAPCDAWHEWLGMDPNYRWEQMEGVGAGGHEHPAGALWGCTLFLGFFKQWRQVGARGFEDCIMPAWGAPRAAHAAVGPALARAEGWG